MVTKFRAPHTSGTRHKDETLQERTILHPKQFEVFKSQARFRCVVAGRRFGKTVLSRTELVKASAKPNCLVWYIAPTYRMAKQIMWREMKEAVPRAWIRKMNETAMTIDLVNGSRIELKGADKPDCYDDETEILTYDGWAKIKTLPEDLSVLTLNPETNTAEWKVPHRHIHEHYSGPMRKIESGRIDLLVTPEHRFLVDSAKGVRKFKKVDELSAKDRIPASVNWVGETSDYYTDDMVAFLGFYLSEGCARKDPGPKCSYEITIAQTEGKKGGCKGDVRSQFIEVLDRLGVSYREHESIIRIYDKPLWKKVVGLGCAWEKRIPTEVLNLPARQLKILVHWMLMGDGSMRNKTENTQRTFYTTSKGMAGDYQEALVKIGRSGSLKIKPNTESTLKCGRVITPKHTLYSVYECKNKHNYVSDREGSYISTVHYEGGVHCVEVENNTVLTRRNGKICWSGNSLRGVGLDFVVFDEFQDMRPQVWDEAIRPTLATTGGKALFIGCVKEDSLVLGKEGMRRIDSYSTGGEDKTLDPLDVDLYGLDQSFHNADGFWNNGVVETRKITSSLGFSLESSLPHPVWVLGEDGTPQWRNTEHLCVGDKIGIASGMNVWGEGEDVSSIDDLLGGTRSACEHFLNELWPDHYSAVDLHSERDAKIVQIVLSNMGILARRVGSVLSDTDDCTIDQGYYWDEIHSLEASEANTMDFTIPDTHSFWSNGFISHNTPKAYNHLYTMWEQGQNIKNIREGTFRSWQFITADSPFIPPREIAMAKRELDPKTFQQEFLASFTTMSGRVYYPFDRKTHVGIHDFNPRLPIWVGQDFNVDPMASCIMQWQPDTNEVWVVDEIVLPNSNTPETAIELERRYWRYKQNTIIYPDASGDNRSTQTYTTDIDILRESGYGRIKAKRKNPLVANRINAVNRMLLSADGKIRLRVDHRCKHTIRALEQVIYKENSREVDKSDNIEHIADALGYAINFEFPTKKLKVMGINI